jgi:polyisoprenoid-binding protein YceI
MKAGRPLFPIVMALATAVSAHGAEECCYAGDATSGTLTFTGAVEGERFTGRFGDFSVHYCIRGEDPASHGIEVRVVLASADSDNRDRDSALMGPEFFAVDRFPVSVWRSTAVRREDEGYLAEGELTLKGISASQRVRYTLESGGGSLLAEGRFVLAGEAAVDRRRHDVGTGEFADPGFIRDQVSVDFRIELARDVTTAGPSSPLSCGVPSS